MPHVQLGSFLSNSIGCGCVAVPAPSHGPTDRRQVRLHSGDSLAGCAGPDKRACGSDQVMKNPSLVPGKRGCPPPSYARRVACRQVDACLPYRAPVPADQVAAQHHHGAHVVHLSRPQLLLCPPHRHVYLCALIPRRSLRAHKVRAHTLRSFHSRPYKRCRPVAMLLHAHIQALQTRCDPYTRANISAADSLRCLHTRIYKRCRYTAIAPHGIFERCRLAAIPSHAHINALQKRCDAPTRADASAADPLRSFHSSTRADASAANTLCSFHMRIYKRCRCTEILSIAPHIQALQTSFDPCTRAHTNAADSLRSLYTRIYKRCRPSFCHFRIQFSFF